MRCYALRDAAGIYRAGKYGMNLWARLTDARHHAGKRWKVVVFTLVEE